MSTLSSAAAPALRAHVVTGGSFVLLWSTGFVFAKLGLTDAGPFTFLGLRFVLAALLMSALAAAARAPWPASWREAAHIGVLGALLHGVYLGGVYLAIARGVPAGITALIVGLQPLLTAALVGPLLGERVSPRQWLGLVLGFGGVALVLQGRIAGLAADPTGYAAAFVGLVGITAGTLYQKRFCPRMGRRSGAAIQYAVASLVAAAAAAAVSESSHVAWTPRLVLALGWLTLAISVGAVSLLTWLIRRGEAARTASLFYLVPPVAAAQSYLAFHETLGPVALLGMVLAVAGVALVVRQ